MSFETPASPLLLNLNENPLTPSMQVQQAIATAAGSLNYYPTNGTSLEANIAAYLGHGLDTNHIIVGHGGSDILTRIARHFIAPGDEAVVPVPSFPKYAADVALFGGVPLLTECRDDFTLDVEALLDQVTPRTRLMYVTSPNNPSGTVMRQSELDFLMENLPRTVLLVFDEVYWHFGCHSERARAYQHLDRENLLILHSFSKAFGLAGLRLGYGIARPSLAARLRLNPSGSTWHNRLLVAAGEAALADTGHVQRGVELIRTQRELLRRGLDDMTGIDRVLSSEASFVSFRPRVSAVWLEQALAARNVLVRELSGFFMPGWMRVSVGLPDANACFLEAVADALEGGPDVE